MTLEMRIERKWGDLFYLFIFFDLQVRKVPIFADGNALLGHVHPIVMILSGKWLQGYVLAVRGRIVG